MSELTIGAAVKEENIMLLNMGKPVGYLPVYAVKDECPMNGQEVIAICDDGFYTMSTYLEPTDSKRWVYAHHEILYWIPEPKHLEGVRHGAWYQEIDKELSDTDNRMEV